MKAVLCVAVSLLIHAVLALAVVRVIESVPSADTLASLDVASVELSFSSEEGASVADAVQSMPADQPVRPPAPKKDFRPPDVAEAPLAQSYVGDIDIARPEATPDEMRPLPQSVAAPAKTQARVDAPPRQRQSIKPVYPKGARRRGEQGEVCLRLYIDAYGKVTNVQVVKSSGFHELDEAAVCAAMAARFEPARSGEVAVASSAQLKLEFKLK